MNTQPFEYIWTTEQDHYVLLKLRFGYSIFNQETKNGVNFDTEEVEEQVIKQCLTHGNKVVEPRAVYVK